MNTPQDKQSKENECLDISIYSQELEDLPWLPSNLGEYKQPSLLKLIPTHNQSCDRISQESQFTQTSLATNPENESLTSSQWDFPAQAQVTQEVEQDLNIQLPLFGEKDLDVLSRLNPASVLSNNLKGLSNEDFELFLGDSLWQDTLGKLKQSRRESLGRVIKGSDYLSFPTLTSNENSTSRPAGQTKCEKWFKDNGLIPSGSQLGTKARAMIMGFPPTWFDCLRQSDVLCTANHSSDCLSPTEPQVESEQDISQVEQLPHHKQRAPSAESSISTRLLGGDQKLLLNKIRESSAKSQLILNKAISLWQPWASLICLGLKQFETRSWKTNYRGKLVICSARKSTPLQKHNYSTLADKYQLDLAWDDLLFGYALAICDLTDCIEMTEDFIQTISETEQECGDWKVGRYAWKLGKIKVLDNPIPVTGKQGLWNIDLDSNLSLSPIKKKLQPKNCKSLEFASLSIPCLVRQPKQPELKGIIHQDLGDRFLVDVDDELISISKLFVYPDFSKSAKLIPPTKQKAPPSKITPTKQRRKKGDGTGYIYRRTITRRGKQYQEVYFRYRDESGKLKAKYIPQRLLSKVQEAESAKKPIADILFLLGGVGISRGEQFSTLNVQTDSKSDELIFISRGERI